VSQTLTGSFDSLSTQVKQVQFAQVKHPKKAGVPPETSTPATSTVETAPESATSAPATVETTPTSAASEPDTPRVETSSTPEVPAPVTPAAETSPAPEVSTPATLPIEAAPATPIPAPDPQLLVGRYPVRKYTDIKDTISKGDTLYNFIRVYENRIFPKRYRDWKALARYNGIRPPQYALKLGAEFRIPTLAHIVLPKTGYETELKQIQSELAKQPNNPELLNQRAIIHFKRNELSQARLTLRQGIRSSPKNSILHNNLGFAYLIIEDDKRAQSEFELAITHSEKPAIPHCNLGILYMTMNKFDLAIKAFESALNVDANLFDAKYNLALAHEKVGNTNSARQHLRGLAQLLSGDAEVAAALERLTSPQVTGE
jgi:Tfp pilus assembly protein PilF